MSDMRFARGLGKLCVACALLVIGRDGYTSFGKDLALLTTSVSDLLVWAAVPSAWLAGPPAGALGAIENWPHALKYLLYAPAALVLGSIGAGLWMAFRKPRQPRVPKPADQGQQSDVEKSALPTPAAGSELQQALWSCRAAFLGTAAFSFIINILMLTGAVFMLEIYDRVLPSRSVPTLIGLCVIASILFAALGLLDVIRSRILVRAGGAIDEALATRVFDVLVRQQTRAGNRGEGLQPLRDLDTIRSFLSSLGPTALFDLPWLPIYLAVIYAFHPALGMTALAGALVLIFLTLLTEVLSRNPTKDATKHAMSRNGIAEASLRNAEVLAGMGFASRLGKLWLSSNERALASQRRASDVTGGLGAIARVLRMVLQSAVLAVGAYLVINQQASAGIIIAGSILSARALAPVDIAIANWRGFIAARQSWGRLGRLLALLPQQPALMPLPAPTTKFQVENVVVAPPGDQKVVVRDVGFALNRGQGLGIIGPSGSGKSSLVRVLVGAWLPVAGRVRLDGAALDQWTPDALGRHVGYLPQGVELFAGSVAQNISRFDPKADPQAIIRAARAADVHDLIVNLPNGYDTEIGTGGASLSAGQRQRVALARALYGDPFLVILDEPDASLDQEGEQALLQAIQGIRARQGIVIVISHRQSVLAAVDLLLALQNGQAVAFGPKELVLQRLRPPAPAVHILKSLADTGTGKA